MGVAIWQHALPSSLYPLPLSSPTHGGPCGREEWPITSESASETNGNSAAKPNTKCKYIMRSAPPIERLGGELVIYSLGDQ
jgi:hypothetical protein